MGEDSGRSESGETSREDSGRSESGETSRAYSPQGPVPPNYVPPAALQPNYPPPPTQVAPPGDPYAPPPPGYAQPYPTYPYSPPPRQRTNGLAVASMVLGILWLYWVGSVLAVIFGAVALRQIGRSNGWQTGRGMAIAGFVLGCVGVGTLLLVAVVAAANS